MTEKLDSSKTRLIQSRDCWLRSTENWLWNQLKNLPKSFHSEVICWERQNANKYPIDQVTHIETSRVENKLQLDGVTRHLRRYRYIAGRDVDLIHSHFGNIAWADIPIARYLGVPHVATFYGLDVGYLPTVEPMWKYRYQILFPHLDLVLCEGPHMKKVLQDLGCSAEKIEVQHIGIETDKIPFEPRNWTEGQPVKVFMAASFKEKKGLSYGLEALGKLNGSYELDITLVGDADSSERSKREKSRMMSIIDEYDLGPFVSMPGYLDHDELIEEALDHHIYLSPSVHSENGDTEGGAPISILEMVATGMPVLSTTHCDIPNLVKHREWGYLTDERDVEGLVDGVGWLLQNSSHWAQMGRRGRDYVDQYFSASKQGKKLGDLYQDLL